MRPHDWVILLTVLLCLAVHLAARAGGCKPAWLCTLPHGVTEPTLIERSAP